MRAFPTVRLTWIRDNCSYFLFATAIFYPYILCTCFLAHFQSRDICQRKSCCFYLKQCVFNSLEDKCKWNMNWRITWYIGPILVILLINSNVEIQLNCTQINRNRVDLGQKQNNRINIHQDLISKLIACNLWTYGQSKRQSLVEKRRDKRRDEEKLHRLKGSIACPFSLHLPQESFVLFVATCLRFSVFVLLLGVLGYCDVSWTQQNREAVWVTAGFWAMMHTW